MRLFKNYKNLYKTEVNNRKLLEDRKKELYETNIELQNQIKLLMKDKAELTIKLEDTVGFLEQEKQCSEALRKERTKLRKKITKLGGNWKDEK